ncbi:prolyl-tRNA synthetase associated domain-containing protein [Companilactobacillus jidongensis]|uniref:prolyl-tRNA synthetase associated domain-containing protein n=1 Tax=Companilactobacillus jidongensis TaxID=2486006 RepID=UPI000F78B8D6|nr:prolyl-tRNA synthetase associated domain-containing protein [Companilactobacillus jidongensis]
MTPAEQVTTYLDNLGIKYKIVEHPAALTTEQADEYIKGMEGVRTKSMFLTNKKKRNFYLVIMDDDKRLDMSEFGEIVDNKRIKMASEESLKEKMNLSAGMVSIFGLLNNTEKDIEVFIQKKIISEEWMTFHPNDNTKTLFIKTADMFTFIKSVGFEYQIIDI